VAGTARTVCGDESNAEGGDRCEGRFAQIAAADQRLCAGRRADWRWRGYRPAIWHHRCTDLFSGIADRQTPAHPADERNELRYYFARGWAASYTAMTFRSSTSVYFWVVERDACPSNS